MTDRRLISRVELSKLIGASVASIDRPRRKGLPTIRVGTLVRFDADRVLTWLNESNSEHAGREPR
ncbi:MAG: hypothetical protein AAF581_21915 [Planctomycetota bacterium]